MKNLFRNISHFFTEGDPQEGAITAEPVTAEATAAAATSGEGVELRVRRLQQVEERVQVRVQDLRLRHQGLLQLQLSYQGQTWTSSSG